MPLPTLSSSDESQLIDGVKQAAAMVQDGTDPTQAIEKLARDRRYPPGFIRMTCHAFNTGRQTTQRESNLAALDKFASFQLADPEAIIHAIYHKEKAAADAEIVDSVYTRPPPPPRREPELVKAASDVFERVRPAPAVSVPNPEEELKAKLASRSGLRKAAEEARRHHSMAKDVVRASVGRTVEYFKQAAATRLPFDLVDYATATYYGADGKAFMDMVADHFPKEKRGCDRSFLPGRIDLGQGPFPAIRDAIQAAKLAHQVLAVKEAADRRLAARENELFPPFALAEKAAGFFDSMVAGATGSTAKSVTDRMLTAMPAPRAELVADEQAHLEDPGHDNELRKIRARAMLNSMMTDPDDPISGHDPEHVLSAYNEISQLMPRASEQPAVMKSLLRRQLEGRTEPFEAEQMLNIEKGVRESKNPPSQHQPAHPPSPRVPGAL